MNVYEVKLKIYMLEDIPLNRIQTKVTAFIDRSFFVDEFLTRLHGENQYKYYVYDRPYAIDEDKIYRKDKIYTLTIRTINEDLAMFFCEICKDNRSREIKGITSKIRVIPKKHIEQIYTLTPMVLKNEDGYWRSCMSVEDFIQRLEINLIKKYNQYTGAELENDFNLYTSVEFLNRMPVSIRYKNIKLLGDKVRIHIADNPIAQCIAYMALGTGIGEMNSRGLGFVNYRWL